MKKEVINILACPGCKGDLVLTIKEEDEGGEVISGYLFCKKCNYNYPIEDGIPNLLPPELNIGSNK